MAAALSPGEAHDAFIGWAKDQSIEINGIAPARFVGRGMGIVAARDLKKGEKLVFVPASAMLSIDTNPVRLLEFPKHISVHGRLAAYICSIHHDKASIYRPWQEVWPTEAEFNGIIPLNWDAKLQDLLPAAGKEILSTQRRNLDRDWKDLKDFLPGDSESVFRYAWLIVNTRCFYWDYPNLPASRLPKKRQSLTADDCYTMCPFMDYFNHADEGCEPNYDASGYWVTANRDYKAGEEVYVSYGSHSNDLLLVEYGFILEENNCDSTRLDQTILSKLTKEQTESLKEYGFYRSYTLYSSPPSTCHRTQAVLRLLSLPPRRYHAFVAGSDEGAADQDRVDSYCHKIMDEYARTIMDVEEEIEGLVPKDSDAAGTGGDKGNRKRKLRSSAQDLEVSAYQKDVLARRWKQIRNMVSAYSRDLNH